MDAWQRVVDETLEYLWMEKFGGLLVDDTFLLANTVSAHPVERAC